MFPQYASGEVNAARAAPALATICALLLLMTGAACKQSGVESNANSNGPSVGANDTSAASTPPFSTKEPERYQWTSVTVVSPGDQARPAGAQVETTTSEVFVARDGEMRREDYELAPGVKVSFLQLPTGRYRLLHAQKLYAVLDDEEGAVGAPPPTAQTQNAPPDFSPDKLNASRASARYRKLGAEEVNGRPTTKYSVSLTGASGETAGDSSSSSTESFIWVDESLGVPVKTEARSSSGARMTIELRDIKLEVDASIFALPPDYKRVDSKEIDMQTLSTHLLGGDRDENDTKPQGK
ncbi:MAG: hypothetical protein WCF57_05745 [Pyrinomonadaceae bacterium]